MITFETIGKLELATLKEGDLVQVLGEFSEGDVALMTGKVYPALHNSSNRLVTIANGLKVEVFPTPLGDKDVTKKYVNQQDDKIKNFAIAEDDKIKEQVNNLHTKRDAIEWRSGLRVTDALQLYVHDGVEYLPKAEVVPFTTGANFNDDNWVLSELMTDKTPFLSKGSTVSMPLIDRFLVVVDAATFGVSPLIYDNTTAINEGLESVSLRGGGALVLTAGYIYQHSGQILIPGNTHLISVGGVAELFSNADMPAELNSVTTKNNPMYIEKADGTKPNLEKFTYIQNIGLENIKINANATERQNSVLAGISELQSCGVKLTSVKNGRLKNVTVIDSIMHCFDVSASNYYFDNNPQNGIDGGSDGVIIEDCHGDSSLYDDIFTTHYSRNIKIIDCTATNSGINPNMAWGNNQHGFEIDDGSNSVEVIRCKSNGLMAGFQAKGHIGAMTAKHVKFIDCESHNDRWSFVVNESVATPAEITGVDVKLVRCKSFNCKNDKTKKYIPTFNNSLEYNRPRVVWHFGYRGFEIDGLDIVGGEGLIEHGQIHTATISPLVRDVNHYKGYTGIYSGLSAYGLINITSGSVVVGTVDIRNIRVNHAIDIPTVRCVDVSIKNLNIHNIESIGRNDVSCILVDLDSPANISEINAYGYSYSLTDTGISGTKAKNYGTNIKYKIENGVTTFSLLGDLDENKYPARVGNQAIDRNTGITYTAKLVSGQGAVGSWVTSSAVNNAVTLD